MINKKDMAIILNKIAVIYGKELDTKLVTAYQLALRNYPRMALADAAMLCVQEKSFMPRPNELVEMIRKYDLERKWQCVEPSTERMYWALFREGYESTDELSEIECREIFGAEYIGLAKLNKAGKEVLKSGDVLTEWRALYLNSQRS
jgi:hypothetical protein